MRMALVAKDRTLCLIILAGVVSEDCLLSIAYCRRGKSSRHESKRFPDKCRLAIATVAGPIAAPAAPKLRGLSAERVNRTT